MTRMLIWNIQQFSINKIFSSSTVVNPGHGGLSDQLTAIQRKQLIVYVLAATQPDIIVVVEVSSGENIAGDLATPTGGIESVALMQYFFNQHAGTPGGWNAVPPLYVGTGGRAETIGIFYRRTNNAGTITRYFTGPNIWTGGLAGSSVPPGGGAPPAAPATGLPLPLGTVNVNGMLQPTGSGAVRMIPAGALHNAGVAENLVAARVNFDDAMGQPIDFQGLRQPYMATFTEANTVGGAVQRDLTLFAIHAPPNNVAAAAYINGLSTMPDAVGALGPNETRVIGGDFNINLLAANGTASGAYNPLTNAPNAYTLLLSPTAGGVPANLDQYRGYFSTHIRGKHNTADSLFLWSNGVGQPSDYPGYNYVGSDFTVVPVYSIDNVLVWPFVGPLANYQTTIMNPVTGTPLTANGAPADNPPTGVIAMAPLWGAPPGGWPPSPTAPDYPGIGPAKNMTGWNNYGRIRSTSDHFGIYVTI
jgi:hypothetical protein